MSYRDFFCATAGLLLLPFTLHAAGDTADKSGAGVIKCRVFAINQAPDGQVFVKTNGAYQPILISKDYVTPSFRTNAKDGIVFYRKVVAPAPKPGEPREKDRYEPFVSCPPDGTESRQLVFLMPADKNGWSAMAKSDVDSAFPAGTRLIFNLSPAPVAFDFGGTQLQLNPRQSGLLKSAKTAPEGIAPIRMIRRSQAGEWVPFLSSVWRQTTDERSIMLIYPVPGTEEVSVISIPDRIEPHDEPKTGPKEPGILAKNSRS